MFSFLILPSFPFFFSLFHLSIFRYNTLREFCFKGLSGITLPRILKFSTNVGYNMFYGKEYKPPPASSNLYSSIFEPQHDKTNKMTVRPAKIQINPD